MTAITKLISKTAKGDRSDKLMFEKLRCKIGLHDWMIHSIVYDIHSPYFGNNGEVKSCVRCKKLIATGSATIPDYLKNE